MEDGLDSGLWLRSLVDIDYPVEWYNGSMEMYLVAEQDPLILKMNILEFAFSHGLLIHPDKDLDGFCQRTITSGHCICKDKELHCPCADALVSCLDKGFCTCRLFLRPDLYLKAIESARERWRRKQNGQADKSLRRRALSTMQRGQGTPQGR